MWRIAVLLAAALAPSARESRADVAVDLKGRWGRYPMLTVRGKHVEVGIVPALGGRIVHLSRPGAPNQLHALRSVAHIRPAEGAMGRLDYGGLSVGAVLQYEQTPQQLDLSTRPFTAQIEREKTGRRVNVILHLTLEDVQVIRRIEVRDDVPRVRVRTTCRSLDTRKVRIRSVQLDAAVAPGGSLGPEDVLLTGRPEGIALRRCAPGPRADRPMPTPHGWWGAADLTRQSVLLITRFAGEVGAAVAGARHGAVRVRFVVEPRADSKRMPGTAECTLSYDAWLLNGRDALAALAADDSLLTAAYRAPTQRLLERLLDRRELVRGFEADPCTLADWGLFAFRVPGSVWGLSPEAAWQLTWRPIGNPPTSGRLKIALTPWKSRRARQIDLPMTALTAVAGVPLRMTGKLPAMRLASEPRAATVQWSLSIDERGDRKRTVPIARHPVLLSRPPGGSVSSLRKRDRSAHRSVWATVAWQLRHMLRPRVPAWLDSDEIIAARAELLQVAMILRDARFLAHRAGTVRRALADAVGPGVRPFTLHVPESYQPTDKMPLAVVLADDDGADIGDLWQTAADDAHCIVLIPESSAATGRIDPGILARDLAEMISVTRTVYNVDRERIGLTGWGRGGTLACLLATRHPDRWCALAPVGAAVGRSLVRSRAASKPDGPRRLDRREDIPPFAGNLVNVPIRIYHGYGDPAAHIGNAARLILRLRSLRVDHEFDPRAMLGHGVDAALAEQILIYLGGFRRARRPAEVRITADRLDEASAYWLRIGRFGRWNRTASVRAIAKDNALNLYVDNVAQLVMRLDESPAASPGGVTVSVNGRTVVRWFTLPRSPQVLEMDAKGLWAFQPSRRRPVGSRTAKGLGLTGPVRDVLRRGFVAVYGTGVDAETAANRAEAERLVKTWRARGVGCAQRTDREYRRSADPPNLVLIGTPASNTVLSRMLGGLDIAVSPAGIRLGRYLCRGEDLGVVACRPNPTAAARAVVVMTARTAKRIAGIAARPVDFDFFVFDGKTSGDPTTALRAGWFGGDWQVDPATLYRRPDPEPPGTPKTP